MSNEIKAFENAEFGSVRTLVINGEPYFVGKDIALILGYAKPRNALAAHVVKKIKRTPQFRATLEEHRK